MVAIAWAGERYKPLCSRLERSEAAQLAGRILEEDEERAGIGAVFEPAVIAAVDLHQLAIRLTAQPRLMEGAALLAREP